MYITNERANKIKRIRWTDQYNACLKVKEYEKYQFSFIKA